MGVEVLLDTHFTTNLISITKILNLIEPKVILLVFELSVNRNY
jgi:hypothetical protein